MSGHFQNLRLLVRASATEWSVADNAYVVGFCPVSGSPSADVRTYVRSVPPGQVRTVKNFEHISGAARKFLGATMRTIQKRSNIWVFAKVHAGFMAADAKSSLELLFFAHWPHARFSVVAQHLNSTRAHKSFCLSANARPLEPVRALFNRKRRESKRSKGDECRKNVRSARHHAVTGRRNGKRKSIPCSARGRRTGKRRRSRA